MEIKVDRGSVTNKDGVTAPLMVKGNPLSFADTIIGFGLIGLGIGYIMSRSFINGVVAMDKAHLDALNSIGCLKPVGDGSQK